MTSQRRQHYPSARTYLVGSYTPEKRKTRLSSLLVGLGAMGVLTLCLVDASSGQMSQTVGVVDRHSVTLAGKIVLPTTVIKISEGPQAGREVTVDRVNLSEGTAVDLTIEHGRWSGDLYGRSARARTKSP